MLEMLILTQSPWMLGTLLGGLGTKVLALRDETFAFGAGLGGYLALMFLGLALGFASKAGVSLPLYALAACSAVCVIALGLVTLASYVPVVLARGVPNRFAIWLSVYLLSLLVFTSVVLFQLPAFGWDVLDFWGVVASRLTDLTLIGSGDALDYQHYQPITLSALMSWGLYFDSLSVTKHTSVWGTLWLSFALSGLLMLYGWSRYQNLNRQLSLVFVALCFSLPLFENHVLVAGYSELPLAVGVLALTVIAGLCLDRPKLATWMLFICVAALVVYTKSIGFAFAATVIVALILVRLWEFQALIAVLCVLAVMVAAVVWVFGSGVQLPSTYLGFDSEHKLLLFRGAKMPLAKPTVAELWSSWAQSRWLNSSFSVLVVAFFCTLSLLRPGSGNSLQKSALLCILVCAVQFVMHGLSQFTLHGLTYSLPGSDTGYSRFTLPTAVCCFLALITACARLEGTSAVPRAHASSE